MSIAQTTLPIAYDSSKVDVVRACPSSANDLFLSPRDMLIPEQDASEQGMLGFFHTIERLKV